MSKYKINVVYNEQDDINNIFIKVLNKELKNFIEVICKKSKIELSSNCTYLSLKEGGKN